MNILLYLRKIFYYKPKLKIYLCNRHQHELLLNIATKYRKYFADQGIIFNISYEYMSYQIENILIRELNNELTKKEIKILNKEKCIYDNKLLLNKIKNYNEKILNILIKNN